MRVIDKPEARAAIDLGPDKVLATSTKAPREVSRVRGYSRGIGQAFSATVSGDLS